MTEKMTAIFSERVTEHSPAFGTFDGVPRLSYDKPERAKVIIDVLREMSVTSGIEITQPREFGIPFIYRVHDQSYIDHLRTVSEQVAQKPPILVAEITDSVNKVATVKEYPAFTYPSVFPHGSNPRSSNHHADKGIYAFDIATPIMGDTYELALLSAYTALTGADILKQGKKLVYAFTRPPGHHAERSRMGSYCYLNNAALAAQFLADQTGERVGIIDIDAHHGNGTQEIFYESSEVFYASIHGDPSKTHPFYSGYADEEGKDSGYGYNLNIPLPIDSDDLVFLKALDLIIYRMRQFSPRYLVVSLGFDGFKNDPSKIFKLTNDGYAETAKRIGKLELPTLSVQEGGYSIPDLGYNIASFLKGLKNV